MKVAKVYWRDSNMYLTQTPKDTKFEIGHFESIGFVLESDKDKIVLAGDLIDDECRRVIVIPRENIANLYIDGKKIKINN